MDADVAQCAPYRGIVQPVYMYVCMEAIKHFDVQSRLLLLLLLLIRDNADAIGVSNIPSCGDFIICFCILCDTNRTLYSESFHFNQRHIVFSSVCVNLFSEKIHSECIRSAFGGGGEEMVTQLHSFRYME